MNRIVRKSLTIGMFAIFILAGWTALAQQQVRIVGLNGRLDPQGQWGEIKVKPGEVVSLTADEVWQNDKGQFEYAYRPVEDFLWTADDREGDTCDPEQDCKKTGNFEVTEYGVNFYVPWDTPAAVTITAKLKWGAGSARIGLVNEQARTPAAEYSEDLEGLGYWVTVGEDRGFVPVTQVEDWAPYQHGYWYWTVFGWTWYSYDPWGTWTDHCGHWRHSILYGWVWIPDAVCVWRPAVVTFYYGPEYVGWYPYDPDWYWGYRHGYADGFDDGYWMGYWAGQRGPGFYHHPHPGFTAVGYGDFYVPGRKVHLDRPGHDIGHHVPDISKKMIDPARANQAFNDAVHGGNVGRVPGGGKDPSSGKDFIGRRTGTDPEETKMKPAWDDSKGRHGKSARMEPERAPHETPSEYRDAARRARQGTGAERGGQVGRVPVGRTTEASSRPSDNGSRRGTAAEPRSRGGAERNPSRWLPNGRTDANRFGASRIGDMTPPAGRVSPDAAGRSGERTGGNAPRPGATTRPDPARPDTGREAPAARRPETDSGHRGPTQYPDHWNLPPEDKVHALRHMPAVDAGGRPTGTTVTGRNVQAPSRVEPATGRVAGKAEPNYQTPPASRPATANPTRPVAQPSRPNRAAPAASTPNAAYRAPSSTPTRSVTAPSQPSRSSTTTTSSGSSSSSTYRSSSSSSSSSSTAPSRSWGSSSSSSSSYSAPRYSAPSSASSRGGSFSSFGRGSPGGFGGRHR